MLMPFKIRPQIAFCLALFIFANHRLTATPDCLLNCTTHHTNSDTIKTDLSLLELLQQGLGADSGLLNQHCKIIYTQADRGANGFAALKQYHFNYNPAICFDPGMAAKLPLTVLVLQRLKEVAALGIDKSTTMLTGAGAAGQTAVYNDPTSIDGKPSIGRYLKKMLVLDDPNAFNRLLEWTGTTYIREQLQARGYSAMNIDHRLGLSLPDSSVRYTNPVKFLDALNSPLVDQPQQYDPEAGVRKDSVCSNPFTNTTTLDDLHTLMISLVFPNKVTASRRFVMAEDDRRYLFKYISQSPSENQFFSNQDSLSTDYQQRRFLIADSTMQQHVRIFNVYAKVKEGLVNVSYIVDFEKKTEYFLSVFIDAAAGEQTFPILKKLMETVYQHELTREKKILPDLTSMIFNYFTND